MTCGHWTWKLYTLNIQENGDQPQSSADTRAQFLLPWPTEAASLSLNSSWVWQGDKRRGRVRAMDLRSKVESIAEYNNGHGSHHEHLNRHVEGHNESAHLLHRPRLEWKAETWRYDSLHKTLTWTLISNLKASYYTPQKNSNSWWRHLRLSKSDLPSQLDSVDHMHCRFAQVARAHRVNNSNELVPGCEMHFGNKHRSLTDETYNWQLNETEHVCAAGHRQERRVCTHYRSLHQFKSPRYVSYVSNP